MCFFSHPAGFPPPPNFLIPHSLSLDHDGGLLFVADRENGRVLTFDTQTGHYRDVYTGFGEKVFAISYSPLQGIRSYPIPIPRLLVLVRLVIPIDSMPISIQRGSYSLPPHPPGHPGKP